MDLIGIIDFQINNFQVLCRAALTFWVCSVTAIKLSRSLSGVEAILLASAPLSQRFMKLTGVCTSVTHVLKVIEVLKRFGRG